MRPFFAHLTKAVVVVVTTFFGSVNAAAPDRILDEAAQLPSSESPSVVESSARRSGAVTRHVFAATHSHRGETMDRQMAAESRANESLEVLNSPELYTMPPTLFGAGNVALSALGKGAS